MNLNRLNGLSKKLLAITLSSCILTIFSYTIESIKPIYAENIYQKIDESVVCLEAEKSGGKRAIGSAFFIAPGILVATNHQVQDANNLIIHYRPLGRAERRLFPAKVLMAQPDTDLSVIQVDFKNHPILPIGDSTNLTLGEEVFTVGCPLGLDHSLAKGFVSQPRRKLKNKLYVQVDMGINHGNSGGPLVTKNGKVIGVIHGRIKESEQLGLAVPTELLLRLIQASENGVLNRIDQEQNVNPYQNGGEVNSNDLQERYKSILREPDPLMRIKRLSQFNREYPTLPEPYFHIGTAYLTLKDTPNAIKYFNLSINKFPNYYKSYSSLSFIHANNKQFDVAKSLIFKSIALEPNYAKSHLILGLIYQNGDKNTPRAIQSFERYIQLEKSPVNRQKIQKLVDRLRTEPIRNTPPVQNYQNPNGVNNDFIIIQ